MKTQQHNMDSRQRYEVTAMVIPPQQHSPTNGQAALDYAGENFHRVADIMLNRPWPEAQQEITDIFADGMRHVMSLPLADRLTAEERNGLRDCHRQLGHLKEEAFNKAERALCQGAAERAGVHLRRRDVQTDRKQTMIPAMKKLLTILSALCAIALTSCQQTKEQHDAYYGSCMETVTYKGHDYIVLSLSRSTNGITHDPDCPCNNDSTTIKAE